MNKIILIWPEKPINKIIVLIKLHLECYENSRMSVIGSLVVMMTCLVVSSSDHLVGLGWSDLEPA